MMLRVLLDARMLLGRFSGVARVVTQLVDDLAPRGDIQVIALCGNEPYGPWVGRSDIEILVTDFSRKDRSPLRRLWWEQTRLRQWIQKSGADVYHAMWNSGIPACCATPSVLTIHDLIPLHRDGVGIGNWRGYVARWAWRIAVRRSMAAADCVTAVSAFTRDEAAKLLGLDAARIRVIPNAVETDPLLGRSRLADCRPFVACHSERSEESPGRKAPNSMEILRCAQNDEVRRSARTFTGRRANRCEISSYLLYVGGFERRKNLAGLFAAVQRYWALGGTVKELRLTGHRDRLDHAAADELTRIERTGRIVFLGEISDSQLAEQYRRAAALLLLSHDEGFGLPVLEAMAHGCPVIAANRASLPEVVGDAGLLVDPDQPDEIAHALINMESPGVRDDWIAKGFRRAEHFSWQNSVERWLDVYYSAAKARQRGRDAQAAMGQCVSRDDQSLPGLQNSPRCAQPGQCWPASSVHTTSH